MDCFDFLREVLMRCRVINESCRLLGMTLIELRIAISPMIALAMATSDPWSQVQVAFVTSVVSLCFDQFCASATCGLCLGRASERLDLLLISPSLLRTQVEFLFAEWQWCQLFWAFHLLSSTSLLGFNSFDWTCRVTGRLHVASWHVRWLIWFSEVFFSVKALRCMSSWLLSGSASTVCEF